MDFPKDLIQKLSILKSSSGLLVPVVIGLVGVLLFVPTQLISSGLKKQIASESISKRGARIGSLSKEDISGEQWEQESQRQKGYASDANKIALLAKQSTQRELLSYKIFPEPQNKSQFTFKEFGERYCAGLEALLRRVNARDCPTEAELNRAFEKSSGRSGSGRGYSRPDLYMMTERRMGTSARAYGGYGESGMLSDVQKTIEDEICVERADSISVYSNPIVLSGYNYWKEYKFGSQIKEAVEDCWYYQLAYWVIEDVINTIDVMNADSDSVLTSPVKRLISANFNLGTSGYRMASPYAGRRPSGRSERERAVAGRPVYIFSLRDALVEPCTGRYCNEDTDVIHFNFVVIVSAQSVLPFMQELCSAKEHKFAGFSGDEQEQNFKHNQITVLESKIRSINREEPLHRFYRYGEDAVVELDLICEYIFTKAGYQEIKPASLEQEQVQVQTEESEMIR